MGVGEGVDGAGNIRRVVGTSEPGGYLRPGVRLNSGEELANGDGHAETSILDYMMNNNIRAISIGAGRPICPACMAAIENAGALPGSVPR